MFPASLSAKWYMSPHDRAEIERQIHVADQIGSEGRHLQAIDTLLSIMVHRELDPASKLGARLNLLIGCEMMRAKAFPLAMNYLLIARENKQALDAAQRRDLNSFLAGVSIHIKDWEQASRAYHESLQIARSSGDATIIPPAENNLGIFHLEKGDLDSAEGYFLRALSDDARLKEHDVYFIGSIHDNLARLYKRRGEYAKALALYEGNVLTYLDGEKKHAWMQALNGVAEMHMQLGHPELALPLLKQAATLLRRCNPRFQEELEAEWLRISLQQARAVGDMQAFDQLARRKDVFQDSLIQLLQMNLNALNSVQAELMQRAFLKEKQAQQLLLAQEQAEIEELQAGVRRIWIYGMLIVISLGLALTLRIRSLRFRQQSLRDQLEIKASQGALMEEKLTQERLANENLELKVFLKQQDLTNFALDNQRKRELLQHLSKQLKKLKPGQVTQPNINLIINDMMLQTQTETITKQYEENIDTVNAEFKSKLLRRFPKLSPMELELCGMVRLGMQAKEIAAVRNVTENAILVARRRLRKKLRIETGVDLRTFLSEE